ncbi:unnamed protein product [Sphagnum jensenii]|uniref:Uncharacterized protein n=1 Tax=Sphagnum jensenii TaxID=128206 RepID=A0ABP1AYB9_9BRYO
MQSSDIRRTITDYKDQSSLHQKCLLAISAVLALLMSPCICRTPSMGAIGYRSMATIRGSSSISPAATFAALHTAFCSRPGSNFQVQHTDQPHTSPLL